MNEANSWKEIPKSIASDFLLILNPLRLILQRNFWFKLGNNESMGYVKWPTFNEDYLKEDEIMFPVQVNGKVRADIYVPVEEAKNKEFVLDLAKSELKVKKYLAEGNLVKEIFVPGRIVNFVVK